MDGTNPHSGNYSAYLCGYSNCSDSISQAFRVPTNAGRVTVSYWWYGAGNGFSTTCDDEFTVTILSADGSVIGTLQHACNTDATQSWQQVSVDVTSDLSAYMGQTVTLVFSATAGSLFQSSSFFVDDVVVSVT